MLYLVTWYDADCNYRQITFNNRKTALSWARRLGGRMKAVNA